MFGLAFTGFLNQHPISAHQIAKIAQNILKVFIIGQIQVDC